MSNELDRLIQRDSVRGMERLIGTVEQVKSLETLAQDVLGWQAAIGSLLMFPGLRGLWTCGSYNASGEAMDISGNDLHLTRSGVTLDSLTAALAPKSFWASDSAYISHMDASDFDLIGNEGYVRSGQDLRGLTTGMWARLNTSSGERWMMSKWEAGADQRSYGLLAAPSGSDNPQFAVSGDGASAETVTSSVSTVTGSWMLVIGRYRSEVTDISIFVNGTWTTNTVSIPSSLFNGTAEFKIGDDDTGIGRGFAGRGSLAFLCHAAVSDNQIENFYHLTAPLFGFTL